MAEHAEIKTSSKHQISANAEKFYSDFWVESEQTNQHSLEMRKVILKRFFPDGLHGKRILEVGVGGEGGLIYLLKEDNEVCGYDVSDAAVKNCIRFGLNVSKVNMDRDTLLFEDGSFDVIFALEVFEHFSNPQHALEELRRVLRPGGLLLISTPSAIVYHWPRLFYPSLFEPEAFGEFLMINGFSVWRHDNHLRAGLKPVPEKEQAWGWYWEARKPGEGDAETYLALGDYFWNQKNRYGMRRYPIEAIDLYRQSLELAPEDLKKRLRLTHALLYRAINGDPEFFEYFDKINLGDPGLSEEERLISMEAFCRIILEADMLGCPIVDEKAVAAVKETAMRCGIEV